MSVVPGEDTESEDELEYETPSDDENATNNTKQSPSQSRGTIVSGEDPETDDELLAETSTTAQENIKTIVSGEESETDEEDRADIPKPKVLAAEAHAGKKRKRSNLSLSAIKEKGSQAEEKRGVSRKTQSHSKLRARVVSFYQQIHTRLTGVYQTIAKNLTGINDSLSQSQQLVEKINILVKQRERDLQALNQELAAVNRTIATLAPHMKAPPPSALQQQARQTSQP